MSLFFLLCKPLSYFLIQNAVVFQFQDVNLQSCSSGSIASRDSALYIVCFMAAIRWSLA